MQIGVRTLVSIAEEQRLGANTGLHPRLAFQTRGHGACQQHNDHEVCARGIHGMNSFGVWRAPSAPSWDQSSTDRSMQYTSVAQRGPFPRRFCAVQTTSNLRCVLRRYATDKRINRRAAATVFAATAIFRARHPGALVNLKWTCPSLGLHFVLPCPQGSASAASTPHIHVTSSDMEPVTRSLIRLRRGDVVPKVPRSLGPVALVRLVPGW